MNSVIRTIEATYPTHRYGGYTIRDVMPHGGSITKREARILYSLVRSTSPTRALEIGCFFGYSTLHIAQALRDAGGTGTTAKLVVLEINRSFIDMARDNLNEAGLGDIVEVPTEIGENTFDLAFIDGDHRPESVMADWERVRKQMNPGGLIVFHDAVANSDVAGVMQHEVKPDTVIETRLGLALKWV